MSHSDCPKARKQPTSSRPPSSPSSPPPTPLTYVANNSCGAIINQPALVSALHANSLRRAALDVTDLEPLPPDDSLWSTPNVIITPHVSGSSVNYAKRAFQVLGENLRTLRDGRKLVNEVVRKKGLLELADNAVDGAECCCRRCFVSAIYFSLMDPKTVYTEATYMNYLLHTESLISLLFYKLGV